MSLTYVICFEKKNNDEIVKLVKKRVITTVVCYRMDGLMSYCVSIFVLLFCVRVCEC